METDPALRRGDCANCFGLCCVALPFAASADFAIDKPAGTPCPNLGEDYRCGIHDRLRDAGFAGCTVYDCFGAGQKVSQVTFGGRDWRHAPAADARRCSTSFPVVRQLHELLWYLAEALGLPAARPVHAGLRRALDEDRGPDPCCRRSSWPRWTWPRTGSGRQRAAAQDQRAGPGRRRRRRKEPPGRRPGRGPPQGRRPARGEPARRLPDSART